MISAKEARQKSNQYLTDLYKELNLEEEILNATKKGLFNVSISTKTSLPQDVKDMLLNDFADLGYTINIKGCYQYNENWDQIIISWK